MRKLVTLFVALATMAGTSAARSEDLPPIVFSEEEIAGICEMYAAGNKMSSLLSWAEIRWGLNRYYASYDKLICGAKRMAPIYHAIHLGPMQSDIRHELAALAALPEAKRRQIVETCYIHRGYGNTMIDMLDRNIHTMEINDQAHALHLLNEYRETLVAMGAVRFGDLSTAQQARCSGG